MATRLIDLRQIRAEKIARSPAWIYERIAAGEFPKPLPLRGTSKNPTSKNLWDERVVDRWLAAFIAKAKQAEQNRETPQRTAKASQARSAALAA